jgi:hypothetical protein
MLQRGAIGELSVVKSSVAQRAAHVALGSMGVSYVLFHDLFAQKGNPVKGAL